MDSPWRSAVAVIAVSALVACSPTATSTGTTSTTAAEPIGPESSTSISPTTLSPTTLSPTTSVAADPGAATITPTGFESVAATVTSATGEVCELCVWLADTGNRRSRGLMFVTDLGEAEAMAFVYPRPRTGSFWMKDTVLPLSIAFFDDTGGYLGDFEMQPCRQDPCPTYPTPPDFVVALETPQGELESHGIGPGSRLELTDRPCPS